MKFLDLQLWCFTVLKIKKTKYSLCCVSPYFPLLQVGKIRLISIQYIIALLSVSCLRKLKYSQTCDFFAMLHGYPINNNT